MRNPSGPAGRVLLPLLAGIALALSTGPLVPPARSQTTVLETDDLRLVYNDATLSWLAPYTARCYQNALRFHRKLWDYRPSEKVNVILDDFGDYGNAGVWTAPRNSMVVHIAPSNNVYETGPSNERMNFTMNHELVHVVALDQASGMDTFFRGLFAGKVRETAEHPETILYSHLTLPRRSAPRWYHEGVAVFFETWMAGGLGRAQGPYDEMVFRSMVRDSTRIYDPLGLESAGTRVDFQVGVNSYLYGTRFMSYLAWEYGPETLIDWVGRRPGSDPSYTAQFRRVYGRSLEQAWREWLVFEAGFQEANLDSVRRHPTTPWRDLSGRALGSVSRPCWDPSDRTLYMAVQYPGTVAHLAALSVDTGEYRRLQEVKGPALYFVSSLALDAAGRTLFYTTDNNDWRDLCAFDLATGRTRRLQRDLRVGDLAFNAADRSLWGVRHFNGLSTLVRIDPPYDDWRQVYTWPYGQDVYDLDISPDGRRLVASHAEISGRQTLRLFDLERLAARDTTSRTLFDFGSSIPTSFVWEPDGRGVVGSSYYTGVSNIFRYNLEADSMEVLSNAETGFFRPMPTGEDSLIVFRYSGEGFVPARIEPAPLSDVSAITFLGERIAARHPVVREWAAPSPATIDLDSLTTRKGAYESVRGIGLANAYPILQGYKEFVAAGVRMDFSDPLQLNRISLTASYTPDGDLPGNERLHLRLAYERHNLEAALHLNDADFYDLFGPTKTGRKGQWLTAAWNRSLVYDTPRTLDLKVGGAGFTGLDRHPLYQNVETSPDFEKLVSGYARLTEKNLRSSIGAIDAETGYRWTATALVNSVRLEQAGSSDWKTNPMLMATFDAGRPLLLRNASAWLRTAGGWCPGEGTDPFANFFFGGFGNNWVDHQDPKRYRDAESFPGLELNEVGGTNFGRVMLDWNLPALRFRRVGTPSLYASWARMSLFGAGLVTNMDKDASRRTVFDVGAQIDLRLTALSHQNLTLSFGYARAFENDRRSGEEFMASLKIL